MTNRIKSNRIDISIGDGQILLRTYSTMMANDNSTNSTDNNFDILLENAQRTIFLKELFSQVKQKSNRISRKRFVLFFSLKLCREASEISNTIQPIVMRNSIKCWVNTFFSHL